MYPIAHFATGIIGGLILLKLFPKIIGDKKKNDVLFLFGSGIFALLPDLPALWGNFGIDNHPVMNLFWFHAYFDAYCPEELVGFQILLIGLAGVLLYLYWKKLK